MTDPLFFDTDCLSAFLWVNNQSLLSLLYPGRIVIPAQVIIEIGTVPSLKTRLDGMISLGMARIEVIQTDTSIYEKYKKLTEKPDCGHKIIGKGEAAAIILAEEYNGILASNNLRDVSDYVEEFGIKHITTGEILKEALNKNLITIEQGDNLWADMLRRRRKLGYPSFTSYLINNP